MMKAISLFFCCCTDLIYPTKRYINCCIYFSLPPPYCASDTFTLTPALVLVIGALEEM